MSAAVMSASSILDLGFGDGIYKNNNIQAVQKARWTADNKAVGSPVGLQPLSRRNSNPVCIINNKLSHNSLLSLGSENNSTSIVNNNNNNNNNIQMTGHRKLDRSQSEPVERNSNSLHASSKTNINTSRYKTELCRPFEESGSCKYGDKCQFAHGAHELRTLVRHPKYKTELCRTFHTIGFCPYGPRCHFIHNAEEARSKASQAVLGPRCQFILNEEDARSKVNQAVPTPPQAMNRPKPLEFGSAFSLGSTADSPSPPSSLSESPTSLGTFFSDDIFSNTPFSPSPTTPSANTAFAFTQDFGPLVRLNSFGRVVSPQKQQQSPVTTPTVVTPPPAPHSVAALNRRNLSEMEAPVAVREPLILTGLEAGSPVNSLSSEMENLNMAGSPKDTSPASSPQDTARSPRLPVFNKLSMKIEEQ